MLGEESWRERRPQFGNPAIGVRNRPFPIYLMEKLVLVRDLSKPEWDEVGVWVFLFSAFERGNCYFSNCVVLLGEWLTFKRG